MATAEDRVVTLGLTIEGVDLEGCAVRNLHATESLSDGCRVLVDVTTHEPLDVEALLAKKASASVRLKEGEERWFHGVVLSAEQDAPRRDQEIFRVRVFIGARVELLKLGRDCRMFQEKSVKDVVTEVLEGAGLSGSAVSWETTTDYAPREYIVQYNESDFAFIERLLHDEGIGFAVRNGQDEDVLVLFDDDSIWVPIEGEATLYNRDTSSLREGTITDFGDHLSVASDKVMLRDYDFRNPATDVSATEESEGTTGREVYVHPGGFTQTSDGKRRAKRLLERLRAKTRVLSGESDAPHVEPGRKFTAEGMARAAMNGDFRVIEVRHRAYVPAEGAGDGDYLYSNHFVAIPDPVPYRPQVATAKPIIGGIQVAFVTVPGGEEIHVDDGARVKARFVWDRSGVTDDKSSTWMRVGQLALGGSMIFPRQDFEITVDYEMGDLDRPFVSGHLYNGEKRPPYELPGGKTRSSIQTATTGGGAGSNEIRFEDAAGSEEIFMNASKDFTTSVDNEASWKVKANSLFKVGSNNTLSVGANHMANVTGSRTLTVGANQDVNAEGSYSDGVGADLSWSIDGNRFGKCGGDHTETTKGTLKRTVGALQHVMGIAGYGRNVVGASNVTVSAAWVEMAGGSRLSSCKGRTENVGALKLVKAKQMSVTCGAAYVMNAAAESVTCGGNRTDSAKGAVAINASSMTVKAKNITLTAETKLTFRGGGCTIELTKAGTVLVKAPTIILKGVKDLKQMMHKSN